MSSTNNHNTLGKIQRMNAETKAEETKRISLELAQSESEQRRYKTEKLKAARLALQENSAPVQTQSSRKTKAKKTPKAES